MARGDTSIPDERKAGSYSKEPSPVSRSKTTVPIFVPHIIISATVILHPPISIRFAAQLCWPFCAPVLVVFRVLQFHLGAAPAPES